MASLLHFCFLLLHRYCNYPVIITVITCYYRLWTGDFADEWPASWGAARPGHSPIRAHLAICQALSDGDSGPDTGGPEAAHQGPACHLPTLMDGGADHSGGLRDRPAPAKAQSKPSHTYVTHGSGVPWQHAPNHAALLQHSPCHSTTPAFNRTQGIPATRPAPSECLGWAAISRPAAAPSYIPARKYTLRLFGQTRGHR